MKKTRYFLFFISLILLLSGCSSSYRSNAHYDQMNQQQHAEKMHQQFQKQQMAQQRANAYRAKQVSYQKRPQTTYRPRLIPKPAPSSQQTRSNAIDKQNHARQLISIMAHSTIGAPYKWGGNNPKHGFDCSGLMSYVHKNSLGINIPRTAAQQRDQSRTITYEQLQVGDMLFFKTGRNSNHVGVYIGNRKFIHAATGSKHVKVASMDSPYWHKRFVKFGTFL